MKKQGLCSFLFLIILVLIFLEYAVAESFHWFQLMGEEELWFRLITEEEDSCPVIVIDGVEYRMDEHHPKDDDFPLSCVSKFNPASLPKSILFEDAQILPRFNKNEVKKIAVIGDTGCRNKAFFAQNCEGGWFFEDIVQVVMQHHPDMVIHVGDYVYRERSKKKRWEAWREDFFAPARRLLESNVPLLLVRGNHECCSRGGEGWTFFLSRGKECIDYESPYKLSINDLEIVVTDSSAEGTLLADIENIRASVNGKKTWIATHRPLVFKNRKGGYTGRISVIDNLKEKVELLLSGHVHVAQFLSFGSFTQLIVGSSGTMLSFMQAGDFSDSRLEYGFAIIDFLKPEVKAINYDRFNNPLMSLTLNR